MCVRGRVASVDVGKDRPLHEAAMRQPYSRCAWAHAAYIDAQPVEMTGSGTCRVHRCAARGAATAGLACAEAGLPPTGNTPLLLQRSGLGGGCLNDIWCISSWPVAEANNTHHGCRGRHLWHTRSMHARASGMRFAECGAQKSMAAELLMWPLSGGARDTGPIDASCTYSNRVGADVPDIGVLRCT
eukprot:364690-Chlamydomonas_euryale.AAC.5